jgi:hypothetical protein
MERGEVLLAVAAKKLYVAERLGTFVFNSKTAVPVLDIMRSGNDIVGDLKEL